MSEERSGAGKTTGVCARAFKIKPRVSRKTAHGTSSDTHRGGLSRVPFHAREQPRLSSSALFSLLFAPQVEPRCSTGRVQWHSSHRFGQTFEPCPIARVIGRDRPTPIMESLKTWESRTLERLSFRKFKRKISRWYVIIANLILDPILDRGKDEWLEFHQNSKYSYIPRIKRWIKAIIRINSRCREESFFVRLQLQQLAKIRRYEVSRYRASLPFRDKRPGPVVQDWR